MDLARLLRKAAADVLRAADDLAQLGEHLGRQAHHVAVLGTFLVVDGARRRRVVAGRGARDAHLRRRQPLDVDVVADGARDHRRVALPVELLGGREPPLEAVAARAVEVEDDHRATTGPGRAALTLKVQAPLSIRSIRHVWYFTAATQPTMIAANVRIDPIASVEIPVNP